MRELSKIMTAERLDQIEDEMETIKQILGAAARMAERNSKSIDRVTDRIDRLTSTIDRLAVSQLNSEERVDQLTSNIDRLAVSQLNLEQRVEQLAVSQLNSEGRVNQLAVSQVNLEETMNRFIQNAEADRTVIREIQTEVRGLQIENRRMMDHLFGQQGGT